LDCLDIVFLRRQLFKQACQGIVDSFMVINPDRVRQQIVNV
jgi:hypothetical protein